MRFKFISNIVDFQLFSILVFFSSFLVSASKNLPKLHASMEFSLQAGLSVLDLPGQYRLVRRRTSRPASQPPTGHWARPTNNNLVNEITSSSELFGQQSWNGQWSLAVVVGMMIIMKVAMKREIFKKFALQESSKKCNEICAMVQCQWESNV